MIIDRGEFPQDEHSYYHPLRNVVFIYYHHHFKYCYYCYNNYFYHYFIYYYNCFCCCYYYYCCCRWLCLLLLLLLFIIIIIIIIIDINIYGTYKSNAQSLYTESPNSLIIVLSMYRPDTALEYLKRIFKWYSTELFSLKCLSVEQCFDPF